ncbi:virulence factor TspB C-terminal domain-related protein [Photobacterium toruni]|uniref:virulence factor TspB C-terminal domain-related protein n=1 Tax=Photobacterium toruni TaxID=1935446 RepID=UPI00210FE5AC|nr:virulence factor TspB C-terminal domain-related protein [Photobacterium toruni]
MKWILFISLFFSFDVLADIVDKIKANNMCIDTASGSIVVVFNANSSNQGVKCYPYVHLATGASNCTSWGYNNQDAICYEVKDPSIPVGNLHNEARDFDKYEGCSTSHPYPVGDKCSSEPEKPPLPPTESCQHDAGKVVESGLSGKPSKVKPWYCVKKCKVVPQKVGDICIGFGDEEESCSYELVSSGYNCDGTGSGAENPDEDGDGNGDYDPDKPINPNPPPPTDPVPDGNGDGSDSDSDGDGKPDGDGSLDPPTPGGDDTGGTGDVDNDGVIGGGDVAGNLAGIVENTARTNESVVQNTNTIGDKLDGIEKAIKDGNGNGTGGGGGDGGNGNEGVNGETCESFVCDGSAIQCYIAKRLWLEKCDIVGVFDKYEDGAVDGINTFIKENSIENIEAGTLDINKMLNHYNGSNGVSTGGTCPAPLVISLNDYGSFNVKFDYLCDLAVIVKVFLMIAATTSVGLMFAKYT